MKDTKSDKSILSIISLFASILVFAGALFIYFYSNGWRINPFDRSVLKTGVLTVESEPFLADIYIDEELKGRTPKSMSLPVGIYSVRVHRDGYRDWNKDVEVKEEKSTPIIPWLIREEITKESVFTLKSEEYIKSWINETADHMFVLTSIVNTSTKAYTYKLWKYDINTTFWDLSPNPEVVLTVESKIPQTLDLLLSPNGQLAVLTLNNGTTTKKYSLDTNLTSTLSDLDVLPIDAFSSHKISWSKDNKYLMFESEDELISYDWERGTRYLLFRKAGEAKYLWATDEQGYFYSIESNPDFVDNVNVYAYILNQTEMDGSTPKVLINDLFFQKNIEYIKTYQADTTDIKYTFFKNSPESTKSVGDITQMRINQTAKGIYISTDQASYWYSMDEKKYILISPYPSTFMGFSNDNLKLIFKDMNGYGVFTFDKDDGDHTMSLGVEMVKNINSDATNVKWLSNSSHIYFIEDNTLYIADKDGDNKTVVLNDIDQTVFTGITYSKENVFTLTVTTSETDPDSINIDRYLIH